MVKIVTPFKQGGSTCVKLTGFVEMGKNYSVERKGNKIILTEVEIREVG